MLNSPDANARYDTLAAAYREKREAEMAADMAWYAYRESPEYTTVANALTANGPLLTTYLTACNVSIARDAEYREAKRAYWSEL